MPLGLQFDFAQRDACSPAGQLQRQPSAWFRRNGRARTLARAANRSALFSKPFPSRAFRSADLPLDQGVAAAHLCRKRCVVGEAIDDGQKGRRAVDVKLRLEHTRGEQSRGDPSHLCIGLREHSGAAAGTRPPGCGPQCPVLQLAPNNRDGSDSVERHRNEGSAVHGLAISTVAIEMSHRLSRQFDGHGAASTLNQHWFARNGRLSRLLVRGQEVRSIFKGRATASG